jgi:hypothetical protein
LSTPKLNQRSCFIYHDESGTVGTDGIFIVGLLFVKERGSLYHKIGQLRSKHRFTEEMHFKDISNPKACGFCCQVLQETLKENIWFRGHTFDNSQVDLSYFGTHPKKARYIAYNYFTKETLRDYTRNEHNAVVYSDAKSRSVKDNFIIYVKDSINNNTQPPKTIIKHLQPIDSKNDDIMQLTDLIIGAINNKETGNRHPLKEAVRSVAEAEFGKKIQYTQWNFRK